MNYCQLNHFKFIKLKKLCIQELECPKSKRKYEKTNRNMEKWSEIVYFLTVKVTVVCLIGPRFVVSFFVYFTTNLGADAFELPILTWFPFNWRNPFGFFLAVSIQYIICTYVFIFVSCTVDLGFGTFLLVTTFTKDIENNARTINECGKNEKTHSQTLETISTFIQSYLDVKQLSAYLAYFHLFE